MIVDPWARDSESSRQRWLLGCLLLLSLLLWWAAFTPPVNDAPAVARDLVISVVYSYVMAFSVAFSFGARSVLEASVLDGRFLVLRQSYRRPSRVAHRIRVQLGDHECHVEVCPRSAVRLRVAGWTGGGVRVLPVTAQGELARVAMDDVPGEPLVVRDTLGANGQRLLVTTGPGPVDVEVGADGAQGTALDSSAVATVGTPGDEALGTLVLAVVLGARLLAREGMAR